MGHSRTIHLDIHPKIAQVDPQLQFTPSHFNYFLDLCLLRSPPEQLLRDFAMAPCWQDLSRCHREQSVFKTRCLLDFLLTVRSWTIRRDRLQNFVYCRWRFYETYIFAFQAMLHWQFEDSQDYFVWGALHRPRTSRVNDWQLRDFLLILWTRRSLHGQCFGCRRGFNLTSACYDYDVNLLPMYGCMVGHRD